MQKIGLIGAGFMGSMHASCYKALADKGAAMLANEADLSGAMLSGIVDSILADRKTVEKMQNAISAFAKPDANQRIWKEIQALIAK